MKTIVLLLVAMLLISCDTSEKHCGRWTATVQGLEMCAADPKCKLSYYGYDKLAQARIERTSWCEVDPYD